jgi:hypothetical protein
MKKLSPIFPLSFPYLPQGQNRGKTGIKQGHFREWLASIEKIADVLHS